MDLKIKFKYQLNMGNGFKHLCQGDKVVTSDSSMESIEDALKSFRHEFGIPVEIYDMYQIVDERRVRNDIVDELLEEIA